MPQRMTGLIYGLMGLCALAGLFLLGLNIYAAAGSGPLWKRRLLGAGLALLAALGLSSCSDGGEPGGGAAGGGTATPAGTGLAASKDWRALCATWKEADEAASGKRGAYPFSSAGKKKLLGELAAAVKTVDRLAGSGELSSAEAGLLKKDLAALTYGVQRKRSKEMMNATCYKPMMVLPARDSAKRLADRLPLLEKLAVDKKLRKAVVERVLISVERDLTTLADRKKLERLEKYSSADERRKAEATRDAVKKQVEKLRKLLSAPAAATTSGLEKAAEWKCVTDAWKFAMPLATSGKSTSKQRKQADVKLKDAQEAFKGLLRKKLLSVNEAALLGVELDKMRKDLYRNPPTDSGARCYLMMAVVPARSSFERVRKRLPLLRKLVAGGKVNRAVTDKLLGSIEKDIAVLSDEKQLARLPGGERTEAKTVRDDVKAELAKLKALLEGGK